MKLATLLVPAYLPPSHPGATPTPYQSGVVDKFEKLLVELAPVLTRDGNTNRLTRDAAGRWVTVQIVTPYRFIFAPDETTLGDAIALTLKTFNIPSVTVIVVDADGAELTLSEAEELQSGIHPWNEV